MAISLLSIPARTAASSTGYPADINIVIQKINELAAAMAVSPLSIAAAVGAGNPAADMNQVVAKVNELVNGVNSASTVNQPPTASIGGSSSATVGTQASYQATAADVDGQVAKVELCLMADSTTLTAYTVLDTDLVAPFALNWTPTSAGNFNLRVRATDDKGEIGFSSVLAVAVANSSTGTTPPTSATRRLLLLVGDSIIAGSTGVYANGTVDPGPGVTDQLATRLGFANVADLDVLNWGFAGKSYQWLIDNKQSTILASIDTSKYYRVDILLACGANDFTNQFASSGYSKTVTGVFAAARSLAQTLRSKAPSLTKIAVASVMNRQDSNATSTFDTDRTAYNNKLLTSDNDFADVVIPATEQDLIYLTNSPADTSVFPDKVHPSGAKGAPAQAEVYAKYLGNMMGLPALSNPAYRAHLGYTAPTTVAQKTPDDFAWQYSQLTAFGSAEILDNGTVRQTAADGNFASGANTNTKFRAVKDQGFIGQYRITCPLRKVHLPGITAFEDTPRAAGQADGSIRTYPQPSDDIFLWQNRSDGRKTWFTGKGVAANDQHLFTIYTDRYEWLLSTGASFSIPRDGSDTKEYYGSAFFGNSDTGDTMIIEQRGPNPVAWNA